MTLETSIPPSSETPAMPESPGQVIRRMRERAGLSLEDLAGQIKLSKSTLDALERDDFAQLGQPVYVRGYYRKCAKVLPLAEQDLISGYEARVKPAAPVAPQRIPLAGGVNSGGAPWQQRQTAIIVVAFGAVLGLMYWLSTSNSTARSEKRAEARPAAQITELPIPSVTESEAPETKTVAAPVEPVATTPVPAPAVAPAPVPAPAAAPAVVPNQLTLQFLEASWVRVEDSRSKTLLIGLVRAGEKQAMKGEPPYTVFIGNARKVRAEFSGRPFDFSNHIQQNDTARFTVP